MHTKKTWLFSLIEWRHLIGVMVSSFYLVLGFVVSFSSYGFADSQVLMDSKQDRVTVLELREMQKNRDKAQLYRDPERQTFMDADEIDYDAQENIVKALGNVEVIRGNLILYADEIRYDRAKNTIKALGNVRLKDHENNILFAKEFQLSGDLKVGTAEAVKGIMADDAIFAANRIKRNSKQESQFDQVVYTPCQLCRTNPKDTPTWAIQSRHMLIDHESGDIEHTDSFLQINGTRVLYVPYLSHPGPTAKRRSGFLTPFFGGSGNLGAIFGASYYWAINPQSDLTVTPIYTRENPLLLLQYRHAFCRGDWNIELSGTKSKFQVGPQNNLVNRNEFRGHIRTDGRFAIDLPYFDESYIGFDINRSLDDTYLKKYTMLGLSKESYLTSRVYAEGFKERSYFLTEGLHFQGLQQDDAQSQIPFIVPSIEWNYLSKPLAYQITPYVDASLLNLQRRVGRNVQRISVLAGLKRQWISALGTVTDMGAEVKTDYYNVSSAPLLNTGIRHNGEHMRIIPKLYGHMRYPLYKKLAMGRLVFEPTIGLVLTASNQNGFEFPDEDSFVELNDANIFDPDRFSGKDFADSWSRFDYGAKLAFYSKTLGNSELFVGQSISLTKVSTVPSQNLMAAGIRQGASDVVVRAHYTYQDWLRFASRLVIDRDNFSAKRNESFVSIGQPIFRVKFGYLKFPRPHLPGQSIEQIKYGFSSQINPRWSVDAHLSRELGSRGGALAHGGSVTYHDDCFNFSTSLIRTHYEDRDYRAGLTVMFTLTFKNLGEFQFSGDRFGLGQGLKD